MQCFIFDFDGTIADSYKIVVNIFNEICHKYKGSPILDDTFINNRDLEIPEILKAHNIAIYKLPLVIREIKFLLNKKFEEVPMVEGMLELLVQLHSKKYMLGIISSNSRQNILNFLKIHNLMEYFTFIHTGSNLFGKQKIIKKAIARHNLKKDQVIYIGDEVRDIKATNELDIKCIIVDWGYNSRKILSGFNPLKICSHPKEIIQYLLTS